MKEQDKIHLTFYKSLLYIVVIVGIPLILTSFSLPLPGSILNIGHIPFSFALTWLIIEKVDNKKCIIYQLLIVNILMILLSMLIEIIQSRIGREFSFADIYFNCLGSSLAVVFHWGSTPVNPVLRNSLRGCFILLVVFAAFPLIKNTIDTIHRYYSFPVLSNFESSLEIERWEGENMSIQQHGKRKNHVLTKTFTTKEFSSLTLKHFPSNWSKYGCLSFKVFSETVIPVSLTLKIYDYSHRDSDNDYHDRYNSLLEIGNGSNNVVINLDQVKVTPKGRNMDMENIDELSIFTHFAASDFELKFDDFELVDIEACDRK